MTTSRDPIKECFNDSAEFGLFKDGDLIVSSSDPEELEMYISVRSKMPFPVPTFTIEELETSENAVEEDSQEPDVEKEKAILVDPEEDKEEDST